MPLDRDHLMDAECRQDCFPTREHPTVPVSERDRSHADDYAQVHAYERDYPGRPWAAVLAGPPAVTGDDMVAAMDAVGVDGALLVSAFTMYRYDASYAIDVHTAHPGRFGLIKPVDPTDPAVAETIADWASTDGTVAIRLMMAYGNPVNSDHPGINRVLDEAARHALPVNLLCRAIWIRPASLQAGTRIRC